MSAVEQKKEVLKNLLDFLSREGNPDSLEFGTPSKGGVVKIYGNFDDPEAFRRKIDNAMNMKVYASSKLGGGQ